MKETDHRTVVVSEERKNSYVLAPLVGVYFLSTLINLSQLGESMPFMGRQYPSDASESIIFLNSIISLYLIVGILKRQRLTLWLLMIYNFVHSVNGITNLLLLPVQQITVSGVTVPNYDYRFNAFWVFFLFLFLNVILYFYRHRFDNKSVYLW